jgi:O-methyltransferase
MTSAARRFKSYTRGCILRLLNRAGLCVFRLHGQTREAFDLIERIKRHGALSQYDHEAYQVYMAVRALQRVPGDLAEIGVYQGGTAHLICEAKGERPLHLFDTFEGLSGVGDLDREHFYEGQFKTCFEAVRARLQSYPSVHFHKGLFPQTAEGMENLQFAFAHCDVDTYESTRSCLKWFYPRMSRGGILLTHDYPIAAGVRQAYAEFFADKPEPVIQLFGNQGLVVKL